MATMESQQFYRTIEKAVETQKFEPVYFLFGEEPYLLQQAISYLKASTLDGNTSDFNFNSYYAADVEISAVKDEVETLPMMASRRVVILREAQDLTDKEWLELESLILSPVETTVFVISANRVDKRKKYFKLLTEKSVAVEFKKPYENQIPGWIRHIGKGHQLQLTDEAIQLFHEWVGNQLIEIDSEMIKLKDFIVPRIKVEVEDVINCVSRRREESVFDLVLFE